MVAIALGGGRIPELQFTNYINVLMLIVTIDPTHTDLVLQNISSSRLFSIKQEKINTHFLNLLY